MSTQIDNIDSIIEKISRLMNVFINFWNNDFAFVEEGDSYDDSNDDSYDSFESSYVSFLKQTHIP